MIKRTLEIIRAQRHKESGKDEGTTRFLEALRDEVLHHKDKRVEFVLRKVTFIIALFGIGSLPIGSLPIGSPQPGESIGFYWLLFAVPVVALAFDVYISAEDYKIKRVGTFCRIYRYAADAERQWERFVNQHREPAAVIASFVLTVIAFLASILLLEPMRSQLDSPGPQFYYGWVVLSSVLMVTVFWYYRFLLGRLPKPHLLSRQVKELLGAPAEDSLEGLRDRLAIALLTGTGITERELERLTFADLRQQMPDGKSALRVKAYRRCPGRVVPYYVDRIDDALPRINYAQEVDGILEKFDEQQPVQAGSGRTEVWWRREQGNSGPVQIAVRLDELVFGELPRFRWLFKAVKTVALFVEKLPLFWSQLRDWMLLGLPMSWSWLRQEVCGRTWAVDRLLIKYPIMIDGMVRTVGAEELRRTYARRLYESEKNLEVLQRYLGCQDVEDVLGYVGPILARIEKQPR